MLSISLHYSCLSAVNEIKKKRFFVKVFYKDYFKTWISWFTKKSMFFINSDHFKKIFCSETWKNGLCFANFFTNFCKINISSKKTHATHLVFLKLEILIFRTVNVIPVRFFRAYLNFSVFSSKLTQKNWIFSTFCSCLRFSIQHFQQPSLENSGEKSISKPVLN